MYRICKNSNGKRFERDICVFFGQQDGQQKREKISGEKGKKQWICLTKRWKTYHGKHKNAEKKCSNKKTIKLKVVAIKMWEKNK